MSFKMIFSKKRVIHALIYELILVVCIMITLSLVFNMSIKNTGVIAITLALVAMFWNVIFNYYFEKIEQKNNWTRNLKVRLLHALFFEIGLLIATIPLIAYLMKISLLEAFILDIGLALGILVYTFIFQWCYDTIELKMNRNS